ncbi:hypothetical protein LV780_12255 [Cereibacter azotoformans]|uniref:Uncharacterized protein n=1 Tax=Cereibacter azotoformans TaxID=43057 RepID=A0A2T5JYV1_9RHOB|nr:hypothetical protein [Cereibacter azotoformans]AXQ94516.1 hypothetical protein D0Z66_12285 [Cereibacter sphaeroides]MBO4170646.1 hypothetical protein [Cereibacter azotoformans]PTR15352.1 hypothetical protein C8J28_11472 [Cereibacter azotoformans]UIJ30068.1 hypothetical protein LV780_12255 [Cereibacter azotoformans]
MDQAAVAARLAELHGRLETLRRQARLLAAAAGIVAAAALWMAAGSALMALAAGLLAALVAGLLARMRATAPLRALARLEREHPEAVALAMDRYRLTLALERAERWKLFR